MGIVRTLGVQVEVYINYNVKKGAIAGDRLSQIFFQSSLQLQKTCRNVHSCYRNTSDSSRFAVKHKQCHKVQSLAWPLQGNAKVLYRYKRSYRFSGVEVLSETNLTSPVASICSFLQVP